MVITRVEKATIAGLAVGGIGVALAAGYAEVKDMKPKPKDRTNDVTEVHLQIPQLPETKTELYNSLAQTYVNNRTIVMKLFRQIGQAIIGPMCAVSAFVALDSAYNVYMTYISDSYGAVKATPTQ